MRDKEIKEGLAELADVAERDHEVQMARAELYKLAKYAIKLHEMLKGVSEAEGLEGWVQSKITKSADMIGSVYHHLEYEEVSGGIKNDDNDPGLVGEGKTRALPERGSRAKKNKTYKEALQAKLNSKLGK